MSTHQAADAQPSWRRVTPSAGVRLMLAASVLLAGIGCADSPPARPTTLARYPRALERLARLMRAEFTSTDPVAVEQEIRCEAARIQHVLGGDFVVRQRLLVDSLHQEFPAEQFNLLGQRLATAPTPSGDSPKCRAINAEAEREVPLTSAAPPALTDSLAANRPVTGDSVR